ncbi:ComEA family DNA-binding protein [Streptomyces sp. WM6368]|uniref:ComEA family DNA-binding protein n=1 Tax=Streptomyces sp. WM6368 TaxID=1415554 RepID=UPI00099DE8C4|nr:ComEA family DNA-binding protein [Streptomyces sp. WM6368]
MTLRTRASYPSGATSGPGRSRLSDSRLRRRRTARRGRRVPHPEPGAVRRRAEALLGGSSPPAALPHTPAEAPTRADPDVLAPAPAAEGAGLSPGAARGLAVRERLPLWLQDRCEVRPRTVAAVAVVLVAAVGFAGQQYWWARPQTVNAPAVVTPGAVPAASAASAGAPSGAGSPGGAARIVVDVSGKVRDPGVRRLPTGSRVEDALAAAGGVRPGTDTTGLNRARVLVDGEQVVVGAPAPPPVAGAGGGPGPGAGPGPLSLGSATVAQLDGLPGVGPVLAQHIVDFRTARGGFRSVEELRQVDGIGERRFADLRTLVRP